METEDGGRDQFAQQVLAVVRSEGPTFGSTLVGQRIETSKRATCLHWYPGRSVGKS